VLLVGELAEFTRGGEKTGAGVALTHDMLGQADRRGAFTRLPDVFCSVLKGLLGVLSI
jgi:hypothetical protein